MHKFFNPLSAIAVYIHCNILFTSIACGSLHSNTVVSDIRLTEPVRTPAVTTSTEESLSICHRCLAAPQLLMNTSLYSYRIYEPEGPVGESAETMGNILQTSIKIK